MDANQLLFYLRGFFELTPEDPSAQQLSAIRAEILSAKPADTNPLTSVRSMPMTGLPPPHQDCGCNKKGA